MLLRRIVKPQTTGNLSPPVSPGDNFFHYTTTNRGTKAAEILLEMKFAQW